MIYRPPYPPNFPLPWWMFVTMLPPDLLLKGGKKALELVKDAREKARETGRRHRTAWEKHWAKVESRVYMRDL